MTPTELLAVLLSEYARAIVDMNLSPEHLKRVDAEIWINHAETFIASMKKRHIAIVVLQ